MALEANEARLRTLVFVTAALVLIQTWLGMFVTLYADTPTPHHTDGANFVANSIFNVSWAITKGDASLVVHASLGVVLALVVLVVLEWARRLHDPSIFRWSAVGGCFVGAAALNGVCFLDFDGIDVTSVLMAVFALASVLCFLSIAFLLTVAASRGSDSEREYQATAMRTKRRLT